MTDLHSAAQRVLDAIDGYVINGHDLHFVVDAAADLRSALQQPQQDGGTHFERTLWNNLKQREELGGRVDRLSVLLARAQSYVSKTSPIYDAITEELRSGSALAQPQGQEAEHETDVDFLRYGIQEPTPGEHGWFAKCSCGWRGQSHSGYAMACTDAAEHSPRSGARPESAPQPEETRMCACMGSITGSDVAHGIKECSRADPEPSQTPMTMQATYRGANGMTDPIQPEPMTMERAIDNILAAHRQIVATGCDERGLAFAIREALAHPPAVTQPLCCRCHATEPEHCTESHNYPFVKCERGLRAHHRFTRHPEAASSSAVAPKKEKR